MSIDTFLMFCLICACVAGILPQKKDRSFLGFFILGFAPNIFGVLMAWPEKPKEVSK